MSTTTFSTWARRIGDASEVPAPFREAFDAAGVGAHAFPLILYSPPFRFDRFATPPRLLARAGERVVLLELRDGAVGRTELALGDVHAIEWGRELLAAWVGLEGERAAIRVDFNAASRDLFLPLVTELRQERYAGEASDYARELARFDHLKLRDFKLMNLARQSLLEGARVTRFFLQPAVKGPVEADADVPGALAILTQRELIVVREGDEDDVGAYAAVWRYLRLDRIGGLRVTAAGARAGRALRVALPGASVVALECTDESEADLRSFADAVNAALGAP